MGPDSQISLPYGELLSRLRHALDCINEKTNAFQLERPIESSATPEKIMSQFEECLLKEVNFAEEINRKL